MRAKFNVFFFFLVYSSQSGAWGRLIESNRGELKAGAQATAFSTGNSDHGLLAMNIIVLAFTIYACYPKLKEMAAVLWGVKWLVAIYIECVLSVVWSAAPGDSFRQGIYLSASLFQFAYIALYFSVEDQIRLTGDVSVLFALLSVPAQYLLTPVHDLAPGWTGIFPSKNYFGNVMAIGIVALLLRTGKWNATRIAKLALCSVLLLLAQGFASILAVQVCIVIIVYLRLSRKARMLTLASVLSGAVMVAIFVPNIAALYLEANGKTTTLTGRDVIWAYSFKRFLERPILGYGYVAFWPAENADVLLHLGWNPNHAHNGFLEVALEEGLVGLGLLLIVFYDGMRRASRQLHRGDPSRAGVWILLQTVYLILHNVSEGDFYQRPAWVFYIVAYIAAAHSEMALPIFHGKPNVLPTRSRFAVNRPAWALTDLRSKLSHDES